jgi:hypothetical protein
VLVDRKDKSLIDNIIEPEEDKAHRLVRTALSLTPVFGGSVVEAFNSIIQPPVERRREEWMLQVTEALNSLIDKEIISLEQLQNNEKFLSTLINVSTLAIKTHEEEKLKALKNVVVNSCIGEGVDDVVSSLFLNSIDSLSSWHIKLLILCHEPVKWAELNNHTFPEWQKGLNTGGLIELFENAYPEMAGKQYLYDVVWKNLFNHGYINQSHYSVNRDNHRLKSRTTDLGDKFVQFISV